MFCMKCGEAIPDGSEMCPKCGANLKDEVSEQAVVYASQKSEDITSDVTTSQQKKSSKKAVGIVAACLCIVTVFLVVNGIGKANLKKALVKEWYALEDSIIKVLDIEDDEIEYRLETGYSWLDTSLGSYDWKVVSSNKIKVNRFGDKYETYTIELNDEQTVLKISPAFTSVDDSETWYYID